MTFYSLILHWFYNRKLTFRNCDIYQQKSCLSSKFQSQKASLSTLSGRFIVRRDYKLGRQMMHVRKRCIENLSIKDRIGEQWCRPIRGALNWAAKNESGQFMMRFPSDALLLDAVLSFAVLTHAVLSEPFRCKTRWWEERDCNWPHSERPAFIDEQPLFFCAPASQHSQIQNGEASCCFIFIFHTHWRLFTIAHERYNIFSPLFCIYKKILLANNSFKWLVNCALQVGWRLATVIDNLLDVPTWNFQVKRSSWQKFRF